MSTAVESGRVRISLDLFVPLRQSWSTPRPDVIQLLFSTSQTALCRLRQSGRAPADRGFKAAAITAATGTGLRRCCVKTGMSSPLICADTATANGRMTATTGWRTTDAADDSSIARAGGLSLHAGIAARADQRAKLERKTYSQ